MGIERGPPGHQAPAVKLTTLHKAWFRPASFFFRPPSRGACELQAGFRFAHPGYNRATHDLTSIYLYRYICIVETAFTILAEPNRRAILSLLASSERSVGEIEHSLRI